jgi:hypothetical protein
MTPDDSRTAARSTAWPELPPLAEWQDTLTTLHLWTQIVGKIRPTKAPWINHSWHVPLYVTARGLTTSAIPLGARPFQIDFDLVAHALRIAVSDGAEHAFALRPMPVADFYRKTMAALGELDLEVRILARPVELPDPVLSFGEDREHASYDAGSVHRSGAHSSRQIGCSLISAAASSAR